MALGPIDGSMLSLVQPHAPIDGGAPAVRPRPELDGASTFGALFEDAVARANAMSHVAHAAEADLAAGRTDDIHGTMIEVQKASIEMKMVGNIKNKVVDAFYELWRMNV